MKNIWALLVVAGLSTPGCKPRPGPPSTEYAEARDKLTEIRRQRAEDAYFDPRIADVLELLSQVNRESVDAPAANSLRAEIEEARAEKARHDAEEAKAIERIRAAPPMPASAQPSPSPIPPVVAAAPADKGPVDAGPPKDPSVGMTEAEFKNLFSDCYEFSKPAVLSNGVQGESWTLKDVGNCRDRHPGSVRHLVVLGQGKVVGIPAEDQVVRQKYKVVDGRLVPMTEEDEKKAAPKPPPPTEPQAQPGENPAPPTSP